MFQEVIYTWGIKTDLSDVPLARTDYNLINSSQSNKSKGNMEKCYFFDKGYYKIKSQCLKSHPSTDCIGQCENKNSYPLRHRVKCKNGTQCIFKSSKSCEFLHIEKLNVDDTILQIFSTQWDKLKSILKPWGSNNDNEHSYYTNTKRLSAMEKDVYKNNQISNIVKQLEKDNKELENKIETSLKQKFEELEGELKNEEQKDSSKNYKSPVNDNITSPFDDLICFLCRKEFRNTT